MCEVRVVSRVTLNANSPALLGHSEDKSPPILRVEIGVGQHQEALVIFQFNVFLKVVKYMACMKLLDFGIWTNSGANYFLLFENGQTRFHT